MGLSRNAKAVKKGKELVAQQPDTVEQLMRMTADQLGEKLTQKQRDLVDHLVSEGGTIGEAALACGYSPDGNVRSAAVTASRTLRLPHVEWYLLKRTAQEIGLSGPAAFRNLVRLSRGAKSEYVQLEASKDILDRAGLKDQSKQSGNGSGVNVEVVIDLS